MVVVSYAGKAQEDKSIEGLTFATATAADRAHTKASWSWVEVACSCFVMAAIIGAYLYFTG